MTISGKTRLKEASSRHRDAEKKLKLWQRTVIGSTWESLMEVRQQFSHADGVRADSGQTITVFNVGGNRYRLLTTIDYSTGIVNVVEFLTHAEYSKEKWKKML